MNRNTRAAKILGLLEQKTPLVRERNVVDTANFSPPPPASLTSDKIPVISNNDDVLPKIQTLPTTTASNVSPSFEDLIQQAEFVTNTDGVFDPELVEVEGHSTGGTVRDTADKNYVVYTANFSPPPPASLTSDKIPVISSNDDVLPKIQTLPTTTASNVGPSFEDLIQQAEFVTNTDGVFDPELVEVEGHSTGGTVRDTADKNYDPIEGPSYSVVVDNETPTIIRLTKIYNHDGNDPSASDSSDAEQVNDENPNGSDWHESDNGAESSDSRQSSSLEFPRNPNSASLQFVSENCSHEDDEISQKKGKKRPCNRDNWVMKKSKTLRNSGLGYISYKSKRSISARKIRPSCGSKCRLKCSEKIKEEVRQQLFSGFWSLGDLQRQREFIVSYSDEIKPKYRYSSTQNFRAMNRAFYFDVNNVRMRVCKQFFMATLDINARTIPYFTFEIFLLFYLFFTFFLL